MIAPNPMTYRLTLNRLQKGLMVGRKNNLATTNRNEMKLFIPAKKCDKIKDVLVEQYFGNLAER